jgi:1-pyrroline-5-carboxylate dehydrogenase
MLVASFSDGDFMTPTLDRIAPFRNEPIRDFSAPADRASLEAALASARKQLGRAVSLIIDGRRIETQETTRSLNPARPGEVVGVVAAAPLAQANEAVAVAAERFERWKGVPAAERAAVLLRAAGEVRRRRDDWNALLILEVGKTWVEADADTAEAIDFLEFYAREALRYEQGGSVTPVPGERNELRYLPLGAGVVIPPWNFAFAIMAGMTSAALVAGNTVVLKPSSDSPVIAARFVELLHEAGAPAGVVNFVPGSGGMIGDALVTHPLTRFIAFTGSKEVGLRVNELAAKPQPGQKWIKRVIAEMGGKDAIIVAADADLDAAADGVCASAFGFSGQKCSACSRAIVEAPVYDAFLGKLLARVAKLRVGDPSDAATDVGPVVSERALTSILRYVEQGKKEGKLVAGGARKTDGGLRDGYYVEPTIFADVPAGAKIAREEIFGPVLAVQRARDLDEALALANDTDFGLTGSIYSAREATLVRARDEFFVGNLYLNRKCTGALVGGHPFGGFNHSGTDSKAGGADYLLLFLQAKLISRKL